MACPTRPVWNERTHGQERRFSYVVDSPVHRIRRHGPGDSNRTVAKHREGLLLVAELPRDQPLAPHVGVVTASADAPYQ